jgi:uncharacterized damage-inducible protein DinB
MRRACFATMVALAAASATFAQAPDATSTYTDSVKTQVAQVRSLVMRTAEKVPEELYAFKPTPDVRSFAGVLGHIADGNYLLCRIANGEGFKLDQSNEKKESRAEILSALKESYAFCDSVLGKLNDASGQELVKFGRTETPKLAVMMFNTSHTWEHYGNLVTYMRLKGIVPPSSERQ